MDIKINDATYSNIEYISVPKADGSGMALFRNMERYYSDSDLLKLLTDNITNINDVNGEITGTLRKCAFASCTNLQSVNLPFVSNTLSSVFKDCPTLQTVSLDRCETMTEGYIFSGDTVLERINIPNVSYIDGNYNFYSLPTLKQLILGQNQVTAIIERMDYNFGGTTNNKNYVPSDLLKLYKRQSLWSDQATRFRSIKQLDQDETDYVLYYIDPILSNPSGYIKNRALCRYTTSVETVYGRQTYIVGRATDTLSVEASCIGYLNKNYSVSLDSSQSTTVTLDLSDMQVDTNFNGYNLVYSDFCKFEQDLGVYGVSTLNGTYAWCQQNTRNVGLGKSSSRYMSTNITLPNLSNMTNPTFVFEANVILKETDTDSYLLASPARGQGIFVNKNSININNQLVINELNLTGEHHIAVVLTRTSIYVYVDGVLIGSTQDKNYFTCFNRTYIVFFRSYDQDTHLFNGTIKQISLCLRDIEDPSVANNCEFLLDIPQQS